MATPVLMPKFGQTMTEGSVVAWEKKVGQAVRKGEVLFKVETDKTELEVEAESDGHLLRIDVKAGVMVPCGTTLAWLGEKGEKP